MKKLFKSLFMLAVVIYGTDINAQSESQEQLVVPLSNPGQQYTLKVNIVEGSIKVTGYEGKEVIIDVKTPANKESKDSKETVNGMRRIASSSGYEVTAKENDNKVTVNTSNPDKHFDLTLKIPQNVLLKLGTVNDGNIEVDNVKGELEVTNVDGEIKLNNISGSVVCNTVDGNITTTFASVSPDAPMAFSTLDGDINVTFPADIRSNFKLKSENGEIYSDFDIEIDKSHPKTSKTNESGVYKVKLEEWIYGKVNGGGPEIMMKNMEGNIYVKKGGK